MSQPTVAPPMIGSTFGDDSPRARRTDPETSQEAADHSLTPAESQRLVLRVLAHTGPLADHEIVDWFDIGGIRISPSRVRTARSELVENMLVDFTGLYHLTPAQRRARVWAITAKGQTVLERII